MDEYKFWLSFWAIVGFTAIILTGALLAHDYYSDQLYLKNGYVRVHVERQEMQFVKGEEKNGNR